MLNDPLDPGAETLQNQLLHFRGEYHRLDLTSETLQNQLDLTCCEQLKRIPPNIIQRLSKHEELYISVSSFRKWTVEGTSGQTGNASLVELNSLLHLAVLWLYIKNNHIPKDFAFPSLNKYHM